MTTRVTKRNGSMITVEATIDVGGPIWHAEAAGGMGRRRHGGMRAAQDAGGQHAVLRQPCASDALQALPGQEAIGSGVTEAACKTLVKQRLCRSGMRWKEDGAQTILSLRALLLTPTRWDQCWRRLEQYGAPAIDS